MLVISLLMQTRCLFGVFHILPSYYDSFCHLATLNREIFQIAPESEDTFCILSVNILRLEATIT